MLVCAIFTHFSTRDRGCSAHPAFPAPSIFEGGKEFACLGRNRAARTSLYVPTSLRAKRSNPYRHTRIGGLLRRFAPRNDGCRCSVALTITTEKSKLPVQPSREDMDRAAVGVVGGVGDELIIRRQRDRLGQRVGVIGFKN